jgi:hypothetical protein
MDYKSVTNKVYKDVDIKICEREDGLYNVDINKQGELVWGHEFVNSFNCAMMKAVSFIDLMPARGY